MELKKILLTAVFSALLAVPCFSQGPRNFVLSHADSYRLGGSVIDECITDESLLRPIEFLADSICLGRAMGTAGSVEAASWISRQFEHIGLMPFGDTFVKSFVSEGRVGHNVIGFCPSPEFSDDYIIVAAHYDNVGTLAGNVYPGADSNASGVSVMLNLATAFCKLRDKGHAYDGNIIFVAFDGKQFSMAGAGAFYDCLAGLSLFNPATGRAITPKRISLMVNLDIIGSTLEPVRKNRSDYLIMLCTDSALQRKLSEDNVTSRQFLDLSFDYYGSKDFTDLFLNRIGDQKVFIDHKIRSALFTSGITMNTNKVNDTVQSLDLSVLRRRTVLIFRWLESMLMPE